ncbi:FtsJ-like methyltransferase [Seminavis robusta]|uniref:FtsJ-like methyltransferase n=1 Tax=Seminavis robusta TaxID=568900 RepID=A0A9N8HM39_9STRA|nr:FtsJ-like methyltransferase [Seminavis robusta]|eukprot:Sro966_g225760.1 FtsJ-like methyltransferase (502) ;mRNA; f:35286-36791
MVMDVEELPANTIGVMVHKQYVDRVKNYLLLPADYKIPWQVLEHTTACTPATKKPKTEPPNTPCTISSQDAINKNAILLDTTETEGMSHDRQGHQILCCKDTVRPIHLISPLARQNMAWAVKLSHQGRSTTGTANITQSMVETLPDMPLVGNSLKQALRVDIYPKSFTEEICLGLQRACHAQLLTTDTDHPVPDSPFDGPVAMTRSASKCSHRLAIIIIHQINGDNNGSTTTTTHDVYWGWMDRTQQDHASIMDIKLNEFARHELLHVAPDHVTGKEVQGRTVPVETPLSRAYYKLDQVWNQVLLSQQQDTLSKIKQASAVDFGSAPGGWTQVLAFQDLFRTVCSVDKGKVADRISQHPKVQYIPSLVEDCQALVESQGPFGMVVCDASLLWNEALDLFEKVIVRKSSSSESDNLTAPKFTLPCIFVITLKLPFQTLQSIRRHIDMIHQRLPECLASMAATMYDCSNPPIQSRHYLLHLMANSTSERTLIVVFEEKPGGTA